MATFRAERRSPLAAGEAWRRVTDWPAHSGIVPLTTVTVSTPPPTRVGTRFTARTGAGPLAFDDPMEVVRWEPPAADDRAGRCRLEKRGGVVTGWAEIEVVPLASGCRVVWREELGVAGLPAALEAVAARAGRLVFGRTLAALLRRPAEPPR